MLTCYLLIFPNFHFAEGIKNQAIYCYLTIQFSAVKGTPASVDSDTDVSEPMQMCEGEEDAPIIREGYLIKQGKRGLTNHLRAISSNRVREG